MESADLDPSSRFETRHSAKARKAAAARNASGRRLTDPATCEREYSPRELEFLNAIREYQRSSGRKFPTWGEVLGVVRGLGYSKGDG